jgi:ribosomal protein S18 acetylase RimI-like enzyme
LAEPTETFAVRRAVHEDLDDLAELFDSYRQFYGQSPDAGAARNFIEARLVAEDSVILIAETGDGRALGFTQLYPTFSSIRMARTYILNDLFVAPEGRGSGVARSLVKEAERFAAAAGASGLDLSTGRNNEAAQALYRSLGWTQDEKFITFHRRLDS